MEGLIAVPVLAALTLGLAGGAHCAVMCGPLCAACVHGRGARSNADLLWLHAGRVLGYSGLGAIVASIGLLAPSSLGQIGWSLLRSIAGLALVVAGLVLLGWKAPQRLAQLTLPHWQRVFGDSAKHRRRPLLLGVGWAVLPCGLLYAALLLTVGSGSPWAGASLMAVFAIGTLPSTYASSLTLLRLGRAERTRRGAVPAGIVLLVLGLLALIAPWLQQHATLGPLAQWLVACLSPAKGASQL